MRTFEMYHHGKKKFSNCRIYVLCTNSAFLYNTFVVHYIYYNWVPLLSKMRSLLNIHDKTIKQIKTSLHKSDNMMQLKKVSYM